MSNQRSFTCTTMYAIRDVVGGFYHSPFFFAGPNADAQALRSFRSLKDKSSGSVIAVNPADFRLVRLATLDTLTGEVQPCHSEVEESEVANG